MICDICGDPGIARNMCWRHYQAWRRGNNRGPGCTCKEDGALCEQCKWLRDPLSKALAGATEDGDCWVWGGTPFKRSGYGVIAVDSTRHTIHRYVYTRMVGPLGRDQIVRHTCGNKICLNPDHLYVEDKTTFAEFAEKAMRDVGIEPLEPYPGSQGKKWKCLCPGCGEEFHPTVTNVVRHSTKGCRSCGIKRREAMYKAQGYRGERKP